MSKKLTTEEFISKSRLIHGDKYDYSETSYINCHTKVLIKCPIHGNFFQLPINHTHKIQKQGCPSCGGSKKLTTMDFIKKSKLIHNDIYDYSKTKYKNNRTKVIIICRIHGKFRQSPDMHMGKSSKNGCPKCCHNRKLTYQEFLKKSKFIHSNLYDYTKVKYSNPYTPIKIRCKKCNSIFLQKPTHHVSGRGCSYCNQSKGELKIKKFLLNSNIKHIQQKKFNGCVNPKTKYPLKYDFYIPDKKILIEFDGEQHFKSGNFGKYIRTSDDLKYSKYKDRIKTKYASKNGIHLLRIKYTDINNVEKILTESLL